MSEQQVSESGREEDNPEAVGDRKHAVHSVGYCVPVQGEASSVVGVLLNQLNQPKASGHRNVEVCLQTQLA